MPFSILLLLRISCISFNEEQEGNEGYGNTGAIEGETGTLSPDEGQGAMNVPGAAGEGRS
jgi:hypothetical protein